MRCRRISLWLLGVTLFVAGCGGDEAMVKRLTSVNTTVRLAATREIAIDAAVQGLRGLLVWVRKGSPREPVVGALIDRLQDPSPEVRAGAAKALGNLRNRQAVPQLLAALTDDTKEVRLEAVGSLGKVRDRGATQALADVMDDQALRLRAIWALGNIGDREAIPLLLPLLADQDKYVRHNAMQALKKLR